MDNITEPRYAVEQLGYSDYGVWDQQEERWVFEGNRDNCEDKAETLNGDEDGCADCGKLKDGTWPYGSDVCLACWDRTDADDSEAADE